MARMDLRHRIARLHPFVWIGAIAVVGALVAWPLGGWDTVEVQSTKTPVYEPGQLVEGHQWSVRVESAEFITEHPDGFSELEPGWRWLRLDLEVTNETSNTDSASDFASDYAGIVTLDDGVLGYGTTTTGPDDRLAIGKAYLVADDTYLPDIQPALPTRVMLIFDVREGVWEVGDDITVGIIDRTPYESTLGSGIRYGFPTLIGDVPTPVEGVDP